MTGEYDVIVVGGGNAAFCAALAAREQGARVLVLERAPEDEAGGNSRFTAGADARGLQRRRGPQALDAGPRRARRSRAPTSAPTPRDQFLDDMARVTEYRCDPDLTEILVKRSLDTVAWMRSKGVRFMPPGAARRSRSTASSSSGAGSRSKPWAAARAWSRR